LASFSSRGTLDSVVILFHWYFLPPMVAGIKKCVGAM
jgi:hypothetical protein